MSSNQATIRINDEVNCTILGLQQKEKEYFWDKYGIFAPSYRFQPKYQLGVWDGKIRFFNKQGKTFVYLLDEIIPKLIKFGYKIKLDDKRKGGGVEVDPIDEDFFSNIIDPKTNEPWKMRDYQVEMVNSLLEEGNGIGVAGTGAGKTSMTAALAYAYEKAAGFRSIIIVPDKNLTEQTVREYAFFGLDVGQYSGDKKDIEHQHIVSTWQSLNRNRTLVQQFQVIVVDECHGAKATVIKELLSQYAKDIPYRFGVTGTLPKEKSDNLTVHVNLGPLRYKIKAHQLIDSGHLANLHIEIIQHEVDLRHPYTQYLEECRQEEIVTPLSYKQFKNGYFTDWTQEKSFLHGVEARKDWIATKIEERRSGGKGNTLCLVNGIKYGERLSKMVDDSVFLSGKDSMEFRKQCYDSFKERDDVVVIATVNIASTGLDIPRIFNLFYIDVGKSFIRTIQTIGRGLRKSHDKDHVNVFDICADSTFSKKHLSERMKYYREAHYPHQKRVIDYY